MSRRRRSRDNRRTSPANRKRSKRRSPSAPDTGNAWYQLDLFYQNHQKWPEAFALLERAFKERPPSELVGHFYYGRASAVSGQNLERGEREMKQWLTTAAPSAPP